MTPTIARESLDHLREKSRVRADPALDPLQTGPRSHRATESDTPAYVLDALTHQSLAGESAESHDILSAAGPWRPETRERLSLHRERPTRDPLDPAALGHQAEETEAFRHALMVAETPEAQCRQQLMIERVQRRAARVRTPASFGLTEQTLFAIPAPHDPTPLISPNEFDGAAPAPAPAAPQPAVEGPCLTSSCWTEQTLFAIPSPHDPTLLIGLDAIDGAAPARKRPADEVVQELRVEGRAKAIKEGRSAKDRERARRVARPP